MKKKLLITLLPVLGATVLVGTAFSAWVFTDQAKAKNTQTLGGTVTIQPMTEQLEITFTEDTNKTFEIDFDQGGVNNTDATKGITTTNLTNDKFAFKIEVPNGFDEEEQEIQVKYYLGLTTNYTKETATSETGSYIEFVNGDTDNKTAVTSGSDFTSLNTNGGNLGKAKYTYASTAYSFTFDLDDDDGNFFKYADNKKPTTADAYNTMVNYYKNDSEYKTLTLFLNVDAQIVDKTTGA